MKAPSHRILVTIDDPFAHLVARESLQEIAINVLTAERLGLSELGIVITDDDRIRALNRDFAGDDHVTDVLSFSLREGEDFANPDDIVRLGEVIVSYPTAERQAREVGQSIELELAHLLVHGILHLLGYDHAAPEEENLMRAREDALLTGHRH
jgi:probable rRNA maturation factor